MPVINKRKTLFNVKYWQYLYKVLEDIKRNIIEMKLGMIEEDEDEYWKSTLFELKKNENFF